MSLRVLVDSVLARARALVDPVDVRMYTAAIISRLNLRTPYGARRLLSIPAGLPVQIAHNNSKSRVLRVDVAFVAVKNLTGGVLRLGDSPTALGATSFAATDPINLFVLRPEEQLYGFAPFATFADVGQEWY